MLAHHSNQKPLRILIVGAGAVGLFYGSRLHQPSRNVLVSLVCRSNYSVIKERGVKLLTRNYGAYKFQPEGVYNTVQRAIDEHPAKAPGTGTSATTEDMIWHYVVVTTKSLSGSSDGATLIQPVVSSRTTIVLIQNGIGIEEPYNCKFPHNILLSAVTVVSAEQIEHGVVRQNMWTRISIGPFTDAMGNPDGGDVKTGEFVRLLKEGGVRDAEACDEREIQFVRWHKLAINASFNPSSVLSNGTPNSVMAADPLLKEHILGVMHEILHLATVVLQAPLPSKFATPEKIIESTLRNTLQNFKNKQQPSVKDTREIGLKQESSRPSMWYDWAGGKPMELDSILGNVVKEAKRVKVDIPRTQSMYALLCMAQKRRDEERKRKSAKL